jgi:hypothetical protein
MTQFCCNIFEEHLGLCGLKDERCSSFQKVEEIFDQSKAGEVWREWGPDQ